MLWGLLACLSLAAIAMAILLEPNHDYVPYIRQWKALLTENHWHKTNAYGPAHNALAILYAAHPKLPKLLFVLSWIACAYPLMSVVLRNADLPSAYRLILIATVLLNPLFWIFTMRFGTNDMLMAMLVLYSVILYCRSGYSWSGIAMGLAISVKFIPVVMVAVSGI